MGLFRSFISFLCEFWQIVSFKELARIIEVITFLDIELFVVFLSYPLASKSIGSVVMSHFPLVIWVISFYFLVSMERGLLIFLNLSFQRSSFWVYYFYWFPVFHFIDFCFISCLLLPLELICSFSSFQRWKLKWSFLNYRSFFFLIHAFNTTNFPLIIAFTWSQKFW